LAFPPNDMNSAAHSLHVIIGVKEGIRPVYKDESSQ
jgi:hypothetical protein